MKKSFIKTVCLLLVFCIALAFSACGDENEGTFNGNNMGGFNFTESDDTPTKAQPTNGGSFTKTINGGGFVSPDVPAEKIKLAEWANVKWEKYTSVYFTLDLPSGWEVQWNGDANQLEWMATKKDYTVGIFNQDHGYAAKDPYMGPSLGFKLYMQNGTVQEYFEALYANSTEYFTVKNSCVPDNKATLQSMRPYTPIRDYQSLYAVFKDANVEGEGLYSAVVMESNDVIVSGRNYGAWEVNCILTQWSPLGQFVSWSPVLARIAQSFAYTDYYLQQWRQIAQSSTSPESGISDTDPVMEAFEERSKADTILQEKRSDMIGEYERVYDNEKGEIYRAYNGFLDDIGNEQTRYTPITDSQYADGFVGWIDK